MTATEEKLRKAAQLLYTMSSRLVAYGSEGNEHRAVITGTYATGAGFVLSISDDVMQAMRRGIEDYIIKLEGTVELERMQEGLRKEEGCAVQERGGSHTGG